MYFNNKNVLLLQERIYQDNSVFSLSVDIERFFDVAINSELYE